MSTILERLQYGFDRNGRRTWRRRAGTAGEDNAYGYDGLSQVTRAALGNLNQNATAISAVPAETETWDYDPTGNWRGYQTEQDGSVSLDQQRVHDKGNRLTQISSDPSPVLLDRAGRMTQVSPDASGDWTESQQIKWDAWGRITQVKNASDGTVAGSYAYDGLTRRTTCTVDEVATHCYYSDQWRPLEERTDTETTAAMQYYWGTRHRDDLVRRDRATTDGGELDETRYVLMDYFSPAAITDESGGVTERYRFSAFGVRTILEPDFTPRSDSECDFEFGFQGQLLDTESGFLNYGYRYYSPQLGRWTCKDPIGGLAFFVARAKVLPKNARRKLWTESLMPPYEFVRNNPPNLFDHLGTDVSWDPPGKCPPPQTIRFIQVVYPSSGDPFTDDGTHGAYWARGDVEGGLYPNKKDGVQTQFFFSDNPEGSALEATYEVCVACLCPPLTVGNVVLNGGVSCVGPCVTWPGSDTPEDVNDNFNLATLPSKPSPTDAWKSTVNARWPNLLPYATGQLKLCSS